MNLFRSDVYENLLMALDTLRVNKLRSFLTLLGVVGTTVIVFALGQFQS